MPTNSPWPAVASATKNAVNRSGGSTSGDPFKNVGDPGPGRHWIRRGKEMILIDNQRGVVARKTISGGERPPRTHTPPVVAKHTTTPAPTSTAPVQKAAPARPKPAESMPPASEPIGAVLESRRFDAPKPKTIDSQMTQRPTIAETTRQATQLTELPPLPETPPQSPQIKLPSDDESRRAKRLERPEEMQPDKMPRLEKEKGSLKAMIDSTTQAIGEFTPPDDEAIVTVDSLEAQANPTSPRELFIDPNSNEAWIVEDGKEMRRFAIGTGDTTGTQYGKKYFSPVGTWQIINEVPYGDVEGGYGPLWMGLSAPKKRGSGYGLHGPHAMKDVNPEGTGFINKGFVSHGCIRFLESDMISVGELLDVGAQVTILPYRGARVTHDNGKSRPQKDKLASVVPVFDYTSREVGK